MGSAIEDHQETLAHPPPTTQQQQQQQSNKLSKNVEKYPMSSFPVATITPLVVPIRSENPMENLTLGQVNQLNNSPKPIRPIPILPVPPSSKMANLNLNKTTALEPPSLSLNLSISSRSPNQEAPANQQSRHASAFKGMPASFNGSGGDSIISVA